MNYSIDFLIDFVEKLTALDGEYKATQSQFNELTKNVSDFSETGRKSAVSSAVANGMKLSEDAKRAVADLRSSENNTAKNFLDKHKEDFAKITRYTEMLNLIRNVDSSFTNPKEYERYRETMEFDFSLTPQGIVDDESKFLEMLYDANLALMRSNKAEKRKTCSSLYKYCTAAQAVLEEEIVNIKRSFFADKANAVSECQNEQQKTDKLLAGYNETVSNYFIKCSEKIEADFAAIDQKAAEMTDNLNTSYRMKLEALQQNFLKDFPVHELSGEYDRIFSAEPNYNDYHCTDEIPRTICTGTIEHNLLESGYSDFTFSLLDRYYSFMYKEGKLVIPQCLAFDEGVNQLFRYDGNASDIVRDYASGMAMRMLMMTQLGKIKFTFYDPIALGGSFVDFSGLVNIDDRSAELINGKIWTSSEDIEDRLRRLTEHISGVTQRCLRGQFNNIYEYNKDAGYNAEPYQIIVIMDYPASLSDNALQLIEQIAQSGSKCGVFILLFESKNQRRQLKGYSVTLADSLESYFPVMDLDSKTGIFNAVLPDKSFRFDWQPSRQMADEQKDTVFDILRAGIKSMERVVIGIDRLKDAEVTDNTVNGIKVPIGIFGVNSIQYLQFGNGSCHHALIAGIAGMGKSSLLHTIIMQCLTQYSPEELQIYLVDFKRGVEFKVYSDYRIPHFKVIAVESEREFGYNVLKAIDREQKVRAEIFKNCSDDGRIERINEFRRTGKKMPRILVIMDEFHELFTEDDEISKQSSVFMERIVRQGRAFGIHLILSSQSYANVKGLDKAVYDQMAVRMVMKCSSDDANMLLENGSGMVDLISTEDAGKAIYNSEAGSKAACSMFRAAYITPDQQKKLLVGISERCLAYPDGNTRVLMSSIEDYVFSKFNRFAEPDYVDDNRQVIVGESLDFVGRMNIGFTRSPRSNLIMIGDNTDKARNLFCFAILSLCIDCWLKNGKQPPSRPIIKLMNFKPLNDEFFVDTLAVAANLLTKYVDYVDCSSVEAIDAGLCEAYNAIGTESSEESYFAVFGYQRAEALRSNAKIKNGAREISPAEMVDEIILNGSASGVHPILWQDRLNTLADDYSQVISQFNMRIAFEMSKESLLAFIMEENDKAIDENSAIYYNNMYDNQKFRVYQTPRKGWIKEICLKLEQS